MPFYAVRKGFNPGVYSNWTECEEQTKGFRDPKFKKFPTREEAEAFVQGVDVAGPSRPTREVAANSTVGPEWDVVYSDGACKGNGQKGSVAGVGVWWGPRDPRNIAERCPGDQTNNRAELIAILRVLETTPMTKKPLMIRSDSKYSMDCVNLWIQGWKRKGWKTANGEPVKNPGIIRLIDAHLTRRAQFGQTVKFEYVKGHSGDVGNDGADLQANEGARKPEVPERDWAGDLEQLLQDQELDIPPEALEVELVNAVASNGRKRSRTPPRVAGPSRAAGNVAVPPQSPKTPTRDTAKRFAAIEQALKSPELGQPVTRRAVIEETLKSPSKADNPRLETDLKSPQVDPEQPPRKRRAVTPPRNGEFPQPVPPTSTKPSSKSTRIADLEAALVGASAPQSSSKAAVPERNGSAQPRHEDYPVRVIYALPPLVPVQKEDINPDDYADCLLSDEDLANEIE